jgi:hypothetical protein
VGLVCAPSPPPLKEEEEKLEKKIKGYDKNRQEYTSLVKHRKMRAEAQPSFVSVYMCVYMCVYICVCIPVEVYQGNHNEA